MREREERGLEGGEGALGWEGEWVDGCRLCLRAIRIRDLEDLNGSHEMKLKLKEIYRNEEERDGRVSKRRKGKKGVSAAAARKDKGKSVDVVRVCVCVLGATLQTKSNDERRRQRIERRAPVASKVPPCGTRPSV
jgi:hypothetical protein